MATVRKIAWTTPGGKRRQAWEYSLQIGEGAERRQERKLFETREEADAALSDRQREIREGKIYGIVHKAFGHVVRDEYLPFKKARRKRTADEEAAVFNTKFIPFFGDTTKIGDITAAKIAQYERQVATTVHQRCKKPVSPSTINRQLSMLRCFLRHCKKWGYLREVPHFDMAREPEGRLRYLERDEAARLLDACQASKKSPYLHAIVTVALHTGMRKGEILELTWDRVDFSRGVMLLERTKSGKRREVPMSQAVYDVLSDLAKRPGAPSEGFVFQKAGGAAWGQITTAFSVALRNARITEFRFHDLRHTCASWLVMDGATLLEVKELLGHKTIDMTLRYAHLAPGRLRDAVSRLDRIFGRQVAAAEAADPVDKAVDNDPSAVAAAG